MIVRSLCSYVSMLALAGIFGLVSGHPAHGASLEVVAITGQPAPDGSGELSSFGQPVMSDSREPTFSAVIRENGFLVKSALFRIERDGTLVMIVDQGRPAPDGNGNYGSLSILMPWINQSGEIAFQHTFQNSLGSFNDAAAMLVGRGGTEPLRIAARAGQVIPGTGGQQVGITIIPLGLDDAGSAAFSNVPLNQNSIGIWRSSDGTISRVVGTGDPNPTGDGVLSGGLFLPSLGRVGSAGQVAFHDITELASDSLGGIYRGASPASITKAARHDDGAPGGGQYSSFFSIGFPTVGGILAINGNNEVAFFAVLEGTPGGIADSVGLFLARSGGTVQLVRRGDPVPGGNGSFLDMAFTDHRLNDRGEVLFGATVSGASGGASSGLFLAGPGGTRTVMRIGDPAPGGGVFTDFSDSIQALNDAGQVVFLGFVGSDSGLFFWENGNLTAILREGDTVPGMGTVSAIATGGSNSSGMDNPGAFMLNRRGETTFGFGAGGLGGIGLFTPSSLVFADGFESGDLSAW